MFLLVNNNGRRTSIRLFCCGISLINSNGNEEWEERIIEVEERKFAWKALEQLFTVGGITQVQKRRFILHTFHGWSTRKISQMEGISHQAVAKSINLALKKLRKFFAAQG